MQFSTEITINKFTGRPEYTCIARDDHGGLIMPTMASDNDESRAVARCRELYNVIKNPRSCALGITSASSNRLWNGA